MEVSTKMNKFTKLALVFPVFLIWYLTLASAARAYDINNNIYQCGAVDAQGSYVLNQSISNASNCLLITSSNILIDCMGYQITFGTGGTNGSIAINATNVSYINTNLSIVNCIISKTNSSGSTSYGVFISRFNNSVIFNNTISTNGTNDNYAIYLVHSATGNNITQNNILPVGSSTNNIGIYLAVGSSNTIISNNNITTLGTATNYGIYALGNATLSNRNNYIFRNSIQTNTLAPWGANNHGIYLITNITYNNITQNNITTNGTTTDHGIFLNGPATDTSVNLN
jgi:hypothetical protein